MLLTLPTPLLQAEGIGPKELKAIPSASLRWVQDRTDTDSQSQGELGVAVELRSDAKNWTLNGRGLIDDASRQSVVMGALDGDVAVADGIVEVRPRAGIRKVETTVSETDNTRGMGYTQKVGLLLGLQHSNTEFSVVNDRESITTTMDDGIRTETSWAMAQNLTIRGAREIRQDFTVAEREAETDYQSGPDERRGLGSYDFRLQYGPFMNFIYGVTVQSTLIRVPGLAEKEEISPGLIASSELSAKTDLEIIVAILDYQRDNEPGDWKFRTEMILRREVGNRGQLNSGFTSGKFFDAKLQPRQGWKLFLEFNLTGLWRRRLDITTSLSRRQITQNYSEDLISDQATLGLSLDIGDHLALVADYSQARVRNSWNEDTGEVTGSTNSTLALGFSGRY